MLANRAQERALIEHLAYRMTKDDVPPILDKRLISRYGALIADTTTEVLGGD